jgi:hypothetical protein
LIGAINGLFAAVSILEADGLLEQGSNAHNFKRFLIAAVGDFLRLLV